MSPNFETKTPRAKVKMSLNRFSVVGYRLNLVPIRYDVGKCLFQK